AIEQFPPALRDGMQAAFESINIGSDTTVSFDDVSAPEQTALEGIANIRSSVQLSETFANPEMTQPPVPEAHVGIPVIGSVASYGMGSGGSSPSFAGGDAGGGYVAPTVNTVVSPASTPPADSNIPDTAPPANNGNEQEKKKDNV